MENISGNDVLTLDIITIAIYTHHEHQVAGDDDVLAKDDPPIFC